MGSLRPLLVAGLAVLVVGNVLLMVGMFTPDWTTQAVSETSDGVELGPIRLCEEVNPKLGSGTLCFNTLDKLNQVPDTKLSREIRAVAAMLILGMIAGLASAAVVSLLLVLQHLEKDRPVILNFVTLALTIASCLFIIIGVIVWAATVHDDHGLTQGSVKLGWSFALSIVGAVSICLGGLIATAGAMQGTQYAGRLLGRS